MFLAMMPQDIERFNKWWFTGKIRSELAFCRFMIKRKSIEVIPVYMAEALVEKAKNRVTTDEA
ncbi:MAG: hypothetical protein ABSD42_09375 [Candidatus Bathyarchaeia archaeon]|jgi:hypothetical protein